MNQVHADPAKIVIDLRSLHMRLCIGLCKGPGSNCVFRPYIASVKLSSSFSAEQCHRTGQMLMQVVFRILSRGHDCDRTFVLTEETGRFISFFRVEPGPDIDISRRYSCITHRSENITVLTCKYSSCSDRTQFCSVFNQDLCLYERIHCRIELHIVSYSDHTHFTAVFAAVYLCQIDKVIPCSCDIHRLRQILYRTAGYDLQGQVGVHSLLIFSGSDYYIVCLDHCILCVKLRHILRADVSDRHDSAESVCDASVIPSGKSHIIFGKCMDPDQPRLNNIHLRCRRFICRVGKANDDKPVQMIVGSVRKQRPLDKRLRLQRSFDSHRLHVHASGSVQGSRMRQFTYTVPADIGKIHRGIDHKDKSHVQCADVCRFPKELHIRFRLRIRRDKDLQ